MSVVEDDLPGNRCSGTDKTTQWKPQENISGWGVCFLPLGSQQTERLPELLTGLHAAGLSPIAL
jgi:hypothetical protein